MKRKIVLVGLILISFFSVYLFNSQTNTYSEENIESNIPKEAIFHLYILKEVAEYKENPQEIKMEVEKIGLLNQSLLDITENDIVSFNYGSIILNDKTSNKFRLVCKEVLSPPDICFWKNIFIFNYKNENVIIGTFHSNMLSQIPFHTYATVERSENKETPITITVRQYPFNVVNKGDSIKTLQNYFYSIGKAKEIWKE